MSRRIEISCGANTLVVDRKNIALYVPPKIDRIIARYRHGFVYLLVGDKQLEMATPVAVKLGLALCDNGGECSVSGDVVQLCINGEELCFLPFVAIQLGGIICKKADRADDWQREALN